MKAVILAGGLGTRLLPYTKTIPKPMLLLGKKPILEYVIKWIKKNGVKEDTKKVKKTINLMA